MKPKLSAHLQQQCGLIWDDAEVVLLGMSIDALEKLMRQRNMQRVVMDLKSRDVGFARKHAIAEVKPILAEKLQVCRQFQNV